MNIKKDITRLLIAGVIANAADFSVYYTLFHFLSFGISKGISFTCGGIAGYLLFKYWIFKPGLSPYNGTARYMAINFLALCINVTTNQAMLGVRPGAVFTALIIATSLTGLFVFFCFKWLVFKVPLEKRFYFMWWKWLPWRFFVKDVARRQGFLDPVKLLSQLQNFAQPSEVAVPTELLRSGAVLHARGLINSLAIQHNLDWVWPYWVECQYDPKCAAFIPRGFSLTQINLTHRNWTALGVPDCTGFPIVDPRGLVTPYYDGWSIDVWIIPKEGEPLIPSRVGNVSQKLDLDEISVITESTLDELKLELRARVIGSAEAPICQVEIKGTAPAGAQLVVSLRPYNPEGVSFINDIAILEDSPGWQINGGHFVYLDKAPDKYIFSDYKRGDVYGHLASEENEKNVSCKVGMASSAAIFTLGTVRLKEITILAPLTKNKIEKGSCGASEEISRLAWKKSLQGTASLQIPDEHFKFLYEAAVRTMILHSPKEVYPGPYLYRRFWFRDAAFILHAMLCVGLTGRVRRALDCFRQRQLIGGYFLSQEGEWDSNGEALWIMRQYCEITGSVPPEEWKDSIVKAASWIHKKRLSGEPRSPHAGLLPSGFSAEHLGPNDFYYWDDFWAVAGLRAAAFLCRAYNDNEHADYFEKESHSFQKSIDQSLNGAEKRLKTPAMPASPYRRLDTGAIGSLVCGYPLRVFGPNDPRVLGTIDFLMDKSMIRGGFFHDMTHSGINPYLTLHLSQALLRAGDSRYFDLMTAVADLATSTGQWPESVHPGTGGGCMGDGQHVWAAAEWVLIIRNCFVREENDRLILCSGIPRIWLREKQPIEFGPAATSFGSIEISIKPREQGILVEWQGQWLTKEPPIDIHFPDFVSVRASPGTNSVDLKQEFDK